MLVLRNLLSSEYGVVNHKLIDKPKALLLWILLKMDTGANLPLGNWLVR